MKAHTLYTKFLSGKGGGWATKASIIGEVEGDLHNGALGHYYCKDSLEESVESTMGLLNNCNIQTSENLDLYYLDDVSNLDNIIDECPKEYRDEFIEQRKKIKEGF